MPMKASPTFCVESGAFSVEEGEEAQTNPGVYGKAFAKWLADRFQEAGRSVDSVLDAVYNSRLHSICFTGRCSRRIERARSSIG